MTEFWKRFVIVDGLVVILIVSVFAWFIMADVASVTSLDQQVSDAGYIRISDDGGVNWHNGLDIDLGSAGIIREMSGDGLDLYTPVYDINGIIGYEKSSDLQYCIEKEFLFETDMTHNLYLGESSFVMPADVNGNISAEGNFSRDYIAGAVRVGFFNVSADGELEPVYIWAPCSAIQYADGVVTANGAVEDVYRYQTGTDMQSVHEIVTGGAANGISDDGSFVWGTPAQDGVKSLLNFEVNDTAPIQKKLVVRVWLEGHDRECVKALHNGNFKMYFDFETVAQEGEQ